MKNITHPRSEELEQHGLSVSLSNIVLRSELFGRSGCRKGNEEGSLFHHGGLFSGVGCFGFLCGPCRLDFHFSILEVARDFFGFL
jgi:hypothetical protein